MILFSGMRPTGRLHLGHLVGALENWAALQDKYDCYFTIADIHALTTAGEGTPAPREAALDIAMSWRALGIDFTRSTVFVQSDVREHTELSVLLGMVTPMSWLERDPTLKSMRDDLHISRASYGLMGYPVLQAADILLYRARAVPVGLDQAPHVEIAREIARAFNRRYGELFPEPEALLTPNPRLAGTDGRKMSKSLGNCIYLDDPPEVVERGVMSLVTDPAKVHATDPGDPDICSVQDYHRLFSPDDAPLHDADCRAGRLGCVAHKKHLAGLLSQRLSGFRAALTALRAEPEETRRLLAAGADRARAVAGETMAEVRARMGMGA